MAIDVASDAWKNYLYLAHTEFYPAFADVYEIRLSRLVPDSSELDTPLTISGHIADTLSQGVNLAIDTGGEVHAVWAVYDEYPSLCDGGQEVALGFTTLIEGGTVIDEGPYRIPGLNVDGIRGCLKPEPHTVRVNSFPAMAVDLTQGPHKGTIYVVWADERNGTPDIFLTKRRRDGEWSVPARVDDDTTATDQWLPWVSVDPDGNVHVVFYDSRIDPDSNLLTTVYGASSYDGGDSFVNYRISDVACAPAEVAGGAAKYAGDYIGITSDRCWAYPCWNDNRSGIHQAYMARVPTSQIWRDSTWTDEVYLTRDLIIAPGATLTVEAGSIIAVSADCDTCKQGADEAKVELVVEGTLIIDGEPNDPVQFSSSGGLDDWYGIRVIDSGQLIIRNAIIRNAYAGVSFEGNNVSGSVDSCVIESCSVYGVYVEADGIRISGSTFRDIGSYGIRAVTAGLHVVGDTFYRCDFGIYQTDAGVSGADTIMLSLFGDGEDTSMIAGVYTRVSPVILQSGFRGSFRTAAVQTGATAWAKPKIHACGFNGLGVGRRAIFADLNSRPTVRCSDFSNYVERNVYCYKSQTNLGKSDDSTVWGNNRIMLPSPDSFAIEAVISTVKAEMNYYYTSNPQDTNFLGPVDWDPYWTNPHSLWDEPGCGYCGCLEGAPPDTGINQTKIAVDAAVPRAFAVEQNYPNPFNPATVIQFHLPAESPVSLRVYNILGQVVRTLIDEVRPAGDYREIWDGRSDAGAAVASGVYLYRVEAGSKDYSRKMVLLK